MIRTSRRVLGQPRGKAGFTLLEVLMATSVMAVGTTSVLVVIASAAGMASQRQVGLRREQVVEEARHDAQAIVNAFHPGKRVATTAVIATKKGTTKAETPLSAPQRVENKRSSRFEGFTYDIEFRAKDDRVPEKGFDVTIVLEYGEDLTYTTTTTMAATTIPDEEFNTSSTWDEEQKGTNNRDKPRETR